ncbi:ABC transporter ATP-binding protein [Bacteroidia bacterium]|nr:ABC transporter ATP-binding protein [Bacteroidia bacterium]
MRDAVGGYKKVLSDISFDIKSGERVLLQGKNGTGKTTLAQSIAGNPDYLISGHIEIDGRNISDENATSRSLAGLFLGAQNVPEIPGLSVMSFLRHSLSSHHQFETGKQLGAGEFFQRLKIAREKIDIPESWLSRSINVGFSGGERKRLMFLRLLLINPKIAILDEPDSGADVDSRQLFSELIKRQSEIGTGFLIISHQSDFAEMLEPDKTLILNEGRIVI